jgi:putative tryptophan/tyrosine transport system substrate-binding protein
VVPKKANGEYHRLPALAVELVNRQVAAIVAGGVVVAQAAKVTTTTIPIVFNSGVDPVTAGIVASLSRPGGNVTGVNSLGDAYRLVGIYVAKILKGAKPC